MSVAISTTQFVRKPIYVDAVRVTEDNFDEIANWCQGEIKQDEVPGKGTGKKYIRVRAHNPINNKQTKAYVGDWILYTAKGYKVYTNRAFRASFDVTNPEEHAGDVIMGSEEIMPGVTLNDAVQWLREQPEDKVKHLRAAIVAGECIEDQVEAA